MKIEHVAFNVGDSIAMADWYVANFNMRIVKKGTSAARAHFLLDSAGSSMIEIYQNDAAPIPDYESMNPSVLHLAFASENVAADVARLVAAGATFIEQTTTTDCSELAMLRDPWGLAIQLCKRSAPML